MDQELHDFIDLLHKRSPLPTVRRRPRRAAIPVAAVLMLVGAVAILGLGWAGIHGLFRAPAAAEALTTARAPAAAPSRAAQVLAEAVSTPEPVTAAPPAPQEAAPSLPASAPVAPPPSLPLQQAAMRAPASPPSPPMTEVAEPVQTAAALPAWIRNAVPAPAKDARPWVAVVIDDLGLDRRRSERAIALPGPLTLSFLPYAMDLARQAEAARKAGHELLVHVPMEPLGKGFDAGPNPLDVGVGNEEVLQRLRWDLSRFEGYVGINNHMGSRFTSAAEALRPVMQELHERGLLFIDSRTVARSAGMEMASEYRVPNAGRDVFLDVEISGPAIAAQLAELERVARHNGSAIAIGHPHDLTLDALRSWLRDLPAKGLVLVPVSAIVRERGGDG